MKYVAAYLLCHASGKANPSKDDVTKVLAAIGAQVDEAVVAQICSKFEGKSVDAVIAEGMGKLATLPAAGAGAAPAAAAAAAAPEAKKETKKEAKKEESEAEDEGDLGFSLFD